MRSRSVTILLFLLAVLTCGLTFWQGKLARFEAIFVKPPVALGERLYDQFKPEQVKRIRISSKGVSATFALTDKGWRVTSPWDDRMDPRAAVSVIQFVLGMRVQDYTLVEKVKPVEVGMGANEVSIQLEDGAKNSLAKLKLGRVTPLKVEGAEGEEPIPTVYVQPRDKHRKNYIYACSGDITPLFKNNLVYLRDHHPLYFNPANLQKIQISNGLGELTMGRQGPGDAWRVAKPLELGTDVEAMKKLLSGLFELQAVKLTEAPVKVVAANEDLRKKLDLKLVDFAGVETVMEVVLPENPTETVAKATVSDRPGVVFDLPTKPEMGVVSLANLPLSLNELRNSKMTHLLVAAVSAIEVWSDRQEPVLLHREKGRPWMAKTEEGEFEANEEKLYALLKAVTEAKVVEFMSDAATDYSPWGLDKPRLKLSFLSVDNTKIELRFGTNGKGEYFVNRAGTASVMRVDPGLVSSIATKSYEWKHGRIWSLDESSIIAIERKREGKEVERLNYVVAQDAWEGMGSGGLMDGARVDFFYGALKQLKVVRWLAMDDESSDTALTHPSLEINVVERELDDDLNPVGVRIRNLILAPATREGKSSFYYGKEGRGGRPFLLSTEDYQNLMVELFEK